MKCMEERRSIRKYQNKPVDRSLIEELVAQMEDILEFIEWV